MSEIVVEIDTYEVLVEVPEVSVDVVVENPEVTVEVSEVAVDVVVQNHEIVVELVGAPGKEGTIILHGFGAPAPDLGWDGYYYLDEDADILYGPKSAGSWPIALDPPGEVFAHELAPDPHPQYLKTTHLNDPDPHPQYLGDEHESAPNPHPQYLTTVPVYTFTQGVLSKVWSIRHNLNKHPVIIVEDGGGSIIQGSVYYVDENQVTITFAFSATGHAHFT